MFHHPCFTASNLLGYEALILANFKMNVVVVHTNVVTSSSSEETVWSALPGPWLTFPPSQSSSRVFLPVPIWQLASLSLYVFPFSQNTEQAVLQQWAWERKAFSPMLTGATLLALCVSLLPSFLPALPTMITFSSRLLSVCTILRIWPSLGSGLRSYMHAVALKISISWLKLKVLEAKRCWVASGLTSLTHWFAVDILRQDPPPPPQWG